MEQLKSICHNCWACVLEPSSRNYWSPCAEQPVLHPQQEKPLQWETHAPQLERSSPLATTREKPVQQWRPSTAKNKHGIIKKNSKENHTFLSYSWYHLTHALCDYGLPVIFFFFFFFLSQTSLYFPRITNKTGCFIKNQNLNLNPKSVPLSGKVIILLRESMGTRNCKLG